MGVAIGLAVPLKLKFGYYVNFILWSLVCEEIYYFIYPALLRLRNLLGWRMLITLVWFASFLTILSNPAAKEYHEFGLTLTWVLGLPCWLLGVRMAERLDLFYLRSISEMQIWVWRCGIWILSWPSRRCVFTRTLAFPGPLMFLQLPLRGGLNGKSRTTNRGEFRGSRDLETRVILCT